MPQLFQRAKDAWVGQRRTKLWDCVSGVDLQRVAFGDGGDHGMDVVELGPDGFRIEFSPRVFLVNDVANEYRRFTVNVVPRGYGNGFRVQCGTEWILIQLIICPGFRDEK